MPRLATSRFALPGAVLLALVLIFAIAWVTQPGTSKAAAQGGQRAAVTSITRSCPPAAPGSGPARISMLALPPASSGSASSGSATSNGAATFTAVLATPAAATGGKTSSGKTATGKSSTPAKAPRPVTVTAPGTVATVTAPGGGGAAVAATGRMAEGFEAEQADASGTGLVSCTHPGSDMWFVGTGQAAGAAQIWLYLMDTGTITASADLTILTDTG